MTKYLTSLTAIIFILLVISYQSKNTEQKMIEKELFGKPSTCEKVFSYTPSNKTVMKAKIINYGAIVVSLKAPDKDGIVVRLIA